MFTLNLNSPSKIKRKVLIEKSYVNVSYISSKKIKAMKVKKTISILLCLLSGFLIIYSGICFKSFNTNIATWKTGERVFLLIFTIISFFSISYYCRHHIYFGYEDDEPEIEENLSHHTIDIEFLSVSWFKKLFSVFFILFVTSFMIFFILAFCTMNWNIYGMSEEVRSVLLLIIGILTPILCGFVYHNVINLIKIEK